MTQIAICGCGGAADIVFRWLLIMRPWFIRCSQCYARTDRAKTLGDAVAFWNLAMTGREEIK